MNIIYEDEYGVEVCRTSDMIAPTIGDMIVIGDDAYRIAARTVYPEYNSVVISITQNSVAGKTAEPGDTTRLNQLGSAILAINKRQDVSEKKTRTIGEQISSVKKHINQRIQQEKKDQL